MLRMFERLLGVMFGGMSLFLGYKLFAIGVTVEQAGDVELMGKLKMRAKAFGPGIFFAAFGALIVSLSFVSRISMEARGSAPTERPAVVKAEPPTQFTTRFNGFEASGMIPMMKPSDAKVLIAHINALSSEQVVSSTAEGRQLQLVLHDFRRHLLARAVPDDPEAVTAYLERLEGITDRKLDRDQERELDAIFNRKSSR